MNYICSIIKSDYIRVIIAKDINGKGKHFNLYQFVNDKMINVSNCFYSYNTVQSNGKITYQFIPTDTSYYSNNGIMYFDKLIPIEKEEDLNNAYHLESIK